MNNILQLKGRFEQRSNSSKPGLPKLPKGKSISSVHLIDLSRQLRRILKYWENNTDINGALVSVHYKHIVAKSNRLKILLSENSKLPSESIRGAKFVWEPNEDGKNIQKHVFIHYVPLTAIEKSIEVLNTVAAVIDKYYKGIINSDITERIADKSDYYFNEIPKTNFLRTVVDGFYIEKFDIDRATEEITEEAIVTIYQTGVDTKKLLSKFGIDIVDERIINDTTLRLNPDEVKLLYNNASYLIAMSVVDFAELTRDDILEKGENMDEDSYSLIPHPTNEPVIGVIDTHFNEKVYFHEWVEYKNLLDPNIPLVDKDYEHGTEVSYIIVDGPQGNPALDDGCGRFRVRHFGVATHKGFSSFTILRLIRNIVATNRDIKVWNLSLGSKLEIKPNFISPEAAELDHIQSEYDVIFVVAGTNIPVGETKKEMKIGSPADSLNSLVVNAVDFKGKSASYARVGPVLSFFHKPDISYYGGDGSVFTDKMVVCRDDMGAAYVSGTSFAAPWISRKLAYLIHVMGLSREIAKALLIDAAASWNRKDDVSHKVGYGIVPKHINDIIHSSNDEIRFIMTGAAEEYETYTYNLPVPIVNNAHPFYARVTLVYFPQCNRNQGVDYTSTEMDIHFGRIISKKGTAAIKTIDNNRQSEEELITLYEEDARKMYRKWDNVKHISEEIKERKIPRKAYDSGVWGLSIKTKERLQSKKKEALPFGVVVTLKEMNGVNRIDDFIKMCMARGWLVNRLDVENQLDIYTRAEEEIEFD
ncbi:MAG: S8 family peptidase [Lachnospiraceae bacterium]|jgi:predicted DNA-binding WGR domain protein|nr:S8 family peptidase [Lachnospiraceae bacterium]